MSDHQAKTTAVDLDADLVARAAAAAESSGVTVAEWIEVAIWRRLP